jgi:hypothetical protein
MPRRQGRRQAQAASTSSSSSSPPPSQSAAKRLQVVAAAAAAAAAAAFEGQAAARRRGGGGDDEADDDDDESVPATRGEGGTPSNNEQGNAGGAGEDRESLNLWLLQRSSQRSSNKSSSTTPPSGNTTAEGGYSRLNSTLRSILFHPVGFPLVRFFNDDPNRSRYSDDATQDASGGAGGGGGGDGDGGSNFDGVLREGYAEYQKQVTKFLEEKRRGPKGATTKPSEEEETHGEQKRQDPKCATAKPSEETLTRILHKLISNRLPATLKAFHQHGLQYDPTKRSQARTDILIRRDDDQDKRGMVLLLEAAWGGGDGDTELWWKKVDQNAQYLDLFQFPRNKEAEGAQFSGPLLFAVLTMDKERAKLDDPSRESAQLGVFLCVPRPPLPAKAAKAVDAAARAVDAAATDAATTDDGLLPGPLPGYRAALLWRDTFTTLADASKGMGKTLRATVALAHMLTDPDRHFFKGFVFLGPNCCRLGDKVRSRGEFAAPALGSATPGYSPRTLSPPLALPRSFAPTTAASGPHSAAPTSTGIRTSRQAPRFCAGSWTSTLLESCRPETNGWPSNCGIVVPGSTTRGSGGGCGSSAASCL